MNAIISLCHFCDNHGPNVLFCTQTFNSEADPSSSAKFFGPVEKLNEFVVALKSGSISSTCEACLSVSKFITNDYVNKISYLSCERPIDDYVAKLVKQAAVRSLSCEVVPGTEGQMYFGDEVRGHVLSHTFFLQDSQARGFHRWYSVVVFMRDKHFLINSWLFFQKHIYQLVVQLQSRAAQVYSDEQKARPQRSLRLSEGDQKAGGNKTARHIMDLTASPQLFAQVHLWFTWLLSTGAKRLEEEIPTRSLDSDIRQRREDDYMVVEEAEHRVDDVKHSEHSAFTIFHLRQLCAALGPDKFKNLLHSLLIGRQVVIRGPQRLVQFVIHLLRFLLPPPKFQCFEFVENYIGPERVNVIGLHLFAAVPVASPFVERLDIVPLGTDEDGEVNGLAVERFQYHSKSGGDVPSKFPTLLTNIYGHLTEPEVSDELAYLLISGLIQKWTHIADVVREGKLRTEGQDMSGLLSSLGAHQHDRCLLQFWAS